MLNVVVFVFVFVNFATLAVICENSKDQGSYRVIIFLNIKCSYSRSHVPILFIVVYIFKLTQWNLWRHEGHRLF